MAEYFFMHKTFLKLKTNNWRDHVSQISKVIEKEIFGSLGGQIINTIRNDYEVDRRKKINNLRKNFIKSANVKNMDKKVNDLTKKIHEINNEIQELIRYDFLSYVFEHQSSLKNICPNCIKVSNYLLGNKKPNLLINYRLTSIINLLIYKSTSQSDKSNAGNAGEFFVSAILDSIGMKKGVHYKCQHKSKSGSDTDIVLPHVEDGKDNEILVCCAIQFTSNDRFRMVSGELKSGKKFAITGNGLDASSKNCDAIGVQIIQRAMQDNHNLICYGQERKRIIEKLKAESKKKKKSGELSKIAKNAKIKLDFYENYSKSFSDFASEIKRTIK